ncbi:hypothetical protein GGU10DRAFT_383650 [Lentinula aff. detonsa]|uniref:SCD domain-containing protein n=1 Tax=Lentinula aff. detonsa TaxID=2804958 RepID=A0AA38NS42_9AGAR|nr:hypothetical protein GGU10DRAFT_383650 [Lentinula aff. detonsa]
MSSTTSPAGPRRSQRDRRQAKPITTFTEPSTTSGKRKHSDIDDEGPPGATDHPIEADHDDSDSDSEGAGGSEEEDERPKKSLKKSKGPPAKKPRMLASSTRKLKAPRVPKGPIASKPKKRANEAPNTPFDPASITKATNISSDNPLFNAILNPNTALQGTVEDFLESLNQDENQALAELVNMILRCCACNDTIDGDTAVDYDGAVDRLDEIAEELKKTTSPAGTYPLISKASPFHSSKLKYSFRANLSEFISRLINSSALLGSLYNSQLVETLQVWLVPMSSSQIRSIRHTSTVIALEVEAALSQVAKEVEKEVELTGRMKEGEKKRARTKGNATGNAKGKDKELDAKLHETQERQQKLEEFIKEFIDGVFIHRYRDLDPVIRTECISSLSTFFETLPSHFCTGSDYLRYVGWVLSDPAASVRSAAVKALQVVYEGAGAVGSSKKKGSGEGVVIPALRHFTTRFLPRLLEIAHFDVDIGVRVAVMHVLGSVDELALLPEDDRNKLGTLVFSDESRVRKGVGRFVSGVWEEWVEEKMGEVEVQPARSNATNGRGRGKGRGGAGANKGRSSGVDRDKVGIKSLARLLVRWGRALDRERQKKSTSQEDEVEDEDEGSEELDVTVGDTDITAGANDRRGIAPTLVAHSGKTSEAVTHGRIGLAVDALWDDMDVVRDWESILDMLILDHSASGIEDASDQVRSSRKAGAQRRSKQSNWNAEGRNASGDDSDDVASNSVKVDQSWRLSEAEEGALLEILVASLRRTRKDGDTAGEPITQALIQALPRLFIKYQTDEFRIVDVLTLPTLMNLEVYLEMRETNAYISLWSDISKQFLTHTSSYVITAAAQTIISHLLTNTTLSNINSEQILELEDELASSLRDAVAGPVPPSSPSRNGETSSSQITRDIEICHLSEDEVLTLTAVIFRLRTLAGHRDMSSWMEDNEGGRHSNPWDILCAVSERARLSVGGEGEMLEQSLQLLTICIMWKTRRLLSVASVNTATEEVQDRENLITQRDSLVDKLIEYAVGTQVQGNGIVEGVKRVAFRNLLDLHVLFLSAADDTEGTRPSLTLVMNDEVQWRCAGYVQAEVERYSDAVEKSRDDEDSDTENDQSDADNDGAEGQLKKKASKKKSSSKENRSEVDPISRPLLEQEYIFIDVMSTFLRAMRTGVIHVRHGAVLLAHYGRLGPAFDSCAKVVIDVLKDEGLTADNGQLVVLVVTQAMKEAFNVNKHSLSRDDANFIALAKLLSSCFILRGGQLTILRRLDTQYIVEIHTNLINWIVKQFGTRSNSNGKDFKSLLPFFRGLIPLVAVVQSRDALKIKAYLDQAWVQAKVDPGTTKMWEPLRAYEKRLGTAMGKDKPSAFKARSGKKTKDGGLSTDGEESETEKLVEDEHTLSDNNIPPKPSRPHPRPRRTASNKKRSPEPSGSDSDPESISPRPIPKAVNKSKAAAFNISSNLSSPITAGKRSRADDEEEDLAHDATPRPSHKRSRRAEQNNDEDPDLQEQDKQLPMMTNGNDVDAIDLPTQSMVSKEHPVSDAAVPKRKKRIRH